MTLNRKRKPKHHANGDGQREKGREAAFMQSDEREGGEHDHDALREVEHARGLEDQDETERNQCVQHAADQSLPQRLHQQIGGRHHLHERIKEDLVDQIQCQFLNARRRDRHR